MRFGRMWSKMLVVPSLLGLAACAPVSYQAPTSGPLSRVRFVTTTSAIAVVRQYDDGKCGNEREMLRIRDGFLFRSDKPTLGMPLNTYRTEAATEVRVRAGTPFFAMYYGSRQDGSTIYSCGVMIDYTFQPDHDYELVYQLQDSVCWVDLKEIASGPSGPQRVSLRTFYPIVPNAECKKVFRSTRWF